MDEIKLEPLWFRVFVYRCAGCGRQAKHHHGGLMKCRGCQGQMVRIAEISFKIEGLEIKVEAGCADEA